MIWVALVGLSIAVTAQSAQLKVMRLNLAKAVEMGGRTTSLMVEHSRQLGDALALQAKTVRSVTELAGATATSLEEINNTLELHRAILAIDDQSS